MYDNSRVTPHTNVSSRPCRLQYSRWSLDVPTTTTNNVGQPSPPASSILSSSFYFPHPHQAKKQVITPNYVNYYPSQKLASMRSLNYERPKSTILSDSNTTNHSTFHVNDLRQRYETKPVIGIVKPMIQQRPYTQLNSNNSSSSSKVPDILTTSYHSNSSTRSLYPSSPATSSPVVYRSRPPPAYNSNLNGQPPMAPRRHSSINMNKCLSSSRSSRTTSTSSSIATVVNELSTTPMQESEHIDDEPIIVDVKRLEMFYGSVGTLVKSARSIARLYTTTTRQLANFEDWSCQQCGVPVWIYNTGANLKRTRQIQLMLAQHESCFAVWTSLVSDQAELRLPKENYITCWIPEANMLAVFKFERNDACRLFFRHYYEILEYERRINLAQERANPPPLPAASPMTSSTSSTIQSNSKEIPRRYSRLRTISAKQDDGQHDLRRCRSLSKIRTVKKSAISGPINFEHVSHISGTCNQQRPASAFGGGSVGSVALRSLHASMSNLSNAVNTMTDRFSKQNKKRASGSFEPRTTAV